MLLARQLPWLEREPAAAEGVVGVGACPQRLDHSRVRQDEPQVGVQVLGVIIGAGGGVRAVQGTRYRASQTVALARQPMHARSASVVLREHAAEVRVGLALASRSRASGAAADFPPWDDLVY